MTDIHFIVNPIAGKGGQVLDKVTLSKYFDPQFYHITVKTSNYAGHSSKLAQESLGEGAKVLVACGGDGTINEVASCLVRTKVLLGIIPMGSGNGLAESLGIPRRLRLCGTRRALPLRDRARRSIAVVAPTNAACTRALRWTCCGLSAIHRRADETRGWAVGPGGRRKSGDGFLLPSRRRARTRVVVSSGVRPRRTGHSRRFRPVGCRVATCRADFHTSPPAESPLSRRSPRRHPTSTCWTAWRATPGAFAAGFPRRAR